MAPVADIFDQAWKRHLDRDFAAAERLFWQLLQTEPSHVDAWCCLAATCQSQGKLADAEAHFRQAVRLMPGHPCAQHDLGIVLAQQGKWDEAAVNFQQFLHTRPADAEAHHNLGMVRAQQGQFDEAAASYQRALQLRPDYAEAKANLNRILQLQNGNRPPHHGRAASHTSAQNSADAANVAQAVYALNVQGVALAEKGKLDEARPYFERALALQPDNCDAHNNLGIIFGNQGRYDDAIVQYQRALQHNPENARVLNNLGTAYQHRGQLAEAAACYQHALRLQPDFVDGHSNLGIVLLDQGHMDEACASFQRALDLKPDHVDALNNLGNVFLRRNRGSEAEDCYRRALRFQPNYIPAHTNLGNALEKQDRFDDAIRCYEQVIRINPSFAPAYVNLGNVRKLQGHFDDALSWNEQALRLDAKHPQPHFNRALLWLMMGNWTAGWPEYEWRWQTPDFSLPSFTQPLWDGSPLAGRTLLVWAEQGFGDTVQFARYLPLLKQSGGKVIVQCQAALRDLLAGVPGIDLLISRGTPPPAFDVQVPLGSLPGIFQSTVNTVPATVPYLHADAALVEKWRKELLGVGRQVSGVNGKDTGHQTQDFRRLLVGIAWQGNPAHRGDRQRSIPLVQFAPLAQLDDVELVSLQVGAGIKQLEDVTDALRVTDLGSRFDPSSFSDAAAAIMSLDLVISVDSVVAHLAGSLGVPVWTALPLVPDWRWLLHREDCPWYSTMRLFRQTRRGQWDDVIQRMAAELRVVLEETDGGLRCRHI